jgi:hypothetical protein
MKIIISESQHRRLFEEQQQVLQIPSLRVFNNDWNQLQKFLKSKGNPPYSLGGDLNLRKSQIESLENLTSVGGDLYLRYTPIKSLGNLTSVGGDLDLENSPIKSLGNLTTVGGDLILVDTPLSKMYTKEQIREMVNVGGNIYIIISDLL